MTTFPAPSFPSAPQNPDENGGFLDGLNPAQREAALWLDGPVLVLAGAGTGKTRVLTARLANLIATGKAVPGQIMAVTFTNKAAGEIRERVAALLGRSVEGWYLGTFHSLAARLLRPHAERLGLKPNFTILGTDDQLRLIKQLLTAENIDEKKSPARAVLGVIERWKDRGLVPADVGSDKGALADGKTPRLYELYQQRLLELNACDFGDLLLHQLTLLRQNPDLLAAFQDRFRYLLVDEYQDTNVAQYLWLRLLAQPHKNICCVGDEDQSIYGWRGAEIGNILRFEEDFPGAKVIRLEENYRSTGHILGAASALIANNEMRLGKTLWTGAEPGDKVVVRTLWDGMDEARWVADEIEALQRLRVPLNQIAVMVRAGFQTRLFEERFIELGLPYRILVGARFYERQEVRDALAYLRLLVSHEDDLALERIVNLPKRGVGPAALQQCHAYAKAAHLPLATAIEELTQTDELKPKLRATLSTLMQNIARWRQLLDTLPHAEVAGIVLDESGYTGMWQADKAPDAPSRLENLKELVSAMSAFDSLPAFLEHVSLVLEATNSAEQEQVSLMTLHGAKGLEFDHVFLPGWEEDIFPSRLTLTENGTKGLEEERRLAYVGLTRARKHASITHVMNRHIYGSWTAALPSRFLAELPPAHVERQTSVHAGAANTGFSGNFRKNHDEPHDREALEDGGYENNQSRRRPPSLWEQLRASAPRHAPPQIEGRAKDVTHTARKPAGPLAPGARVFHEKFGQGTVMTAQGDKLEIRFDRGGAKKVMAGFVSPAQGAEQDDA